jgi:hypothetical protein
MEALSKIHDVVDERAASRRAALAVSLGTATGVVVVGRFLLVTWGAS